ncbi:hypothetical protein CRYUN_Cryun12cG0022900 [Craigia yunnanensis]
MRSPSKSEPRRYFHEDAHSSRSGNLRCQSGDNRGRYYRRAFRSPVDDRIPHHGRSFDNRKHIESRGASSVETDRSFKSRELLAEDHNNDRGGYSDEKICEPYSNLQDHLPSASLVPLSDMAHSAKTDCCPTKKVGNGPERLRKSEHGLDKGTNACTKFRKTQETNLKDMIVKKKELDETSLINQAFDCRDGDPSGNQSHREERNLIENTIKGRNEWINSQSSYRRSCEQDRDDPSNMRFG